MEELIIQEELANKRLDIAVSLLFPELTRAQAQKLIKEGGVLVDGKPRKASYPLTAGERLSVTLPEPEATEVLPENIPLDILYEDKDVIVINKPKGMVVHPAAGHTGGTLVNALLYHCKDSLSGINGILRPGIVHRIDKDTTGVIIACKNDRAHQCIAEQLKAHSITRRYLALAQGRMQEEEGTVDAPLGRDPENRKRMKSGIIGGKHAVTHYRVLERFAAATYLECRLETTSDSSTSGLTRPSVARRHGLRQREKPLSSGGAMSACGGAWLPSSGGRPLSGVHGAAPDLF